MYFVNVIVPKYNYSFHFLFIYLNYYFSFAEFSYPLTKFNMISDAIP